jgi:hypothetical protein
MCENSRGTKIALKKHIRKNAFSRNRNSVFTLHDEANTQPLRYYARQIKYE